MDRAGINVLPLVHAARLQYGLRTSDYARYHRHATRRISTLHRGLRKKSNVKKVVYTAEAVQKDERLLELLVWEAERAWAEGLRTREELAALERDPNNKVALARKRHRSAKRLARASQHAQKLAQLLQTLQSSFPVSNTLQAHIYSLYMQGYHDFVLASASASSSSSVAQEGVAHLSTAYILLESFAKDTQRSTDEALAYELLDELEPMIRFCAYTAETPSEGSVAELARATGMPHVNGDDTYERLLNEYRQEQEKVGKKVGKKGDQERETVKAIKWRDIDIPIRSAELSSALSRVQTALQNLQDNSSKAKKRSRKTATDKDTSSSGHAAQIVGGENAMNDYDRALATLSESAERSKKLVDDNAVALSKAQSTRFESATRPLSLANSYITFQLLSIRLRRDEALFASVMAKLSAREAGKSTSTKRASARNGQMTTVTARRRAKTFPVLIKLLESILQSLEQLRELDIVEDDSEDLAGIVDSKIGFDKAQRCFYLAQTYALLERYPEALTLFQRASLYLRQVHSHDSDASDTPSDASDTPSNASIKHLLVASTAEADFRERLAQAEDRARKDWFVYQYSQDTKAKEGLDSAIGKMDIDEPVSLPKKSKKAGPLFFDVAFNYVAGIDIDILGRAALGEVVSETPEPQASGIQSVAAAAANKVEEAVEVVTSNVPAGPETPSKTGGGIWGFFGRGKK